MRRCQPEIYIVSYSQRKFIYKYSMPQQRIIKQWFYYIESSMNKDERYIEYIIKINSKWTWLGKIVNKCNFYTSIIYFLHIKAVLHAVSTAFGSEFPISLNDNVYLTGFHMQLGRLHVETNIWLLLNTCLFIILCSWSFPTSARALLY